MQRNSVKVLVTTFLSFCSKLQELELDFSWSNLLADFGEYLGVKDFGFIKVSLSTKGFDAKNKKVLFLRRSVLAVSDLFLILLSITISIWLYSDIQIFEFF